MPAGLFLGEAPLPEQRPRRMALPDSYPVCVRFCGYNRTWKVEIERVSLGSQMDVPYLIKTQIPRILQRKCHIVHTLALRDSTGVFTIY